MQPGHHGEWRGAPSQLVTVSTPAHTVATLEQETRWTLDSDIYSDIYTAQEEGLVPTLCLILYPHYPHLTSPHLSLHNAAFLGVAAHSAIDQRSIAASTIYLAAAAHLSH